MIAAGGLFTTTAMADLFSPRAHVSHARRASALPGRLMTALLEQLAHSVLPLSLATVDDAYDRSDKSGMLRLKRERTGCRQPLDITTIKDADDERAFWNAERQFREDAPSVG